METFCICGHSNILVSTPWVEAIVIFEFCSLSAIELNCYRLNQLDAYLSCAELVVPSSFKRRIGGVAVSGMVSVVV